MRTCWLPPPSGHCLLCKKQNKKLHTKQTKGHFSLKPSEGARQGRITHKKKKAERNDLLKMVEIGNDKARVQRWSSCLQA